MEAMKKAVDESTKLLVKQELVVKTAADRQRNVTEESVFRTCPKGHRRGRTFFLKTTLLCFYGPGNPILHLVFTMATP